MHLNHPETTPPPQSMEKSSSTKPVHVTKKIGYCVYIHLLLFGFPSHLGHHRALSRVPCAIQ